MTTRTILIIFFFLFGILIPVLANEFVAANTSAAIAMVGSCIIIALLIWSRCVLFINIILAVYVFQNYLTRPFVSIFEKALSTKQLNYIEALSSYFNPEAAAVVYWSLFSLLFAWLVGLVLTKDLQKDRLFSTPYIFKMLDKIILKGGGAFWFAWASLFILNYRSLGSGLHSTIEGGDSSLFLWGMASLSTINIVCFFVFIKRQNTNLTPQNYYLLLPPAIEMLLGVLYGGRSAAFYLLVNGLLFWLALNINKKWTLKSTAKAFLVIFIALTTAVLSGLFAQTLRPLYRYTESVNVKDVLETLDYESVLLVKENLLFGITQLLQRLSALQAQFYILNDWYIHEPWQHYNPLAAMMRVANDLVPGDIFDGMLTINQLWDYIYLNNLTMYSSQMWGIQGTLYLYFGHFLAPIVVFILAALTNRLYPSIEKSIWESPAFASIFLCLLFEILSNGTIERIIPVDIVRPLASLFIFLLLYKALSIAFISLNQTVKNSKRQNQSLHSPT